MVHLYYRIVRFLNRFITFTPEWKQDISTATFLQSAERYIGFPYVLGGDGTSIEWWIDCSHLISRALIDTGCTNSFFFRTARYLANITHPVKGIIDSRKWDLLFLYDETGIYHVAIIIEKKWENLVNILDASGPNTGIWSTQYRDIDLTHQKYIIGRIPYLI